MSRKRREHTSPPTQSTHTHPPTHTLPYPPTHPHPHITCTRAHPRTRTHTNARTDTYELHTSGPRCSDDVDDEPQQRGRQHPDGKPPCDGRRIVPESHLHVWENKGEPVLPLPSKFTPELLSGQTKCMRGARTQVNVRPTGAPTWRPAANRVAIELRAPAAIASYYLETRSRGIMNAIGAISSR